MDYLIDIFAAIFVKDDLFTQCQIDQISENSAVDIVVTIQYGIAALACRRAGVMPTDRVSVGDGPLPIRPSAAASLCF